MKLRNFWILLVMALSISSVQAQLDPELSGGLAWSNDSSFIVVGSKHGIHVHSVEDMSVLVMLTTDEPVSAVLWGNTTNEIIYGTQDGRVFIYDIKSEKNNSHIKPIQVRCNITCLASQ